MKKTKEKILETALNLFNLKGYTQVSLRMVSDEMGISIGNLTYHFNKKEEIVSEHFESFCKLLLTSYESDKLHVIEHFLRTTQKYYEAIFKYRYFVQELLFLRNNFPEFYEIYSDFGKQRMNNYRHFFNQLRDGRYLFEETINGYDEMLYKQLEVHNNFWITQKVIDNITLEQDIIAKNGIMDLYAMLLPYLTLGGKRVFNSYLKELKIT